VDLGVGVALVLVMVGAAVWYHLRQRGGDTPRLVLPPPEGGPAQLARSEPGEYFTWKDFFYSAPE